MQFLVFFAVTAKLKRFFLEKEKTETAIVRRGNLNVMCVT
jgi:hypothetical protein